jgi:hypothetical protein
MVADPLPPRDSPGHRTSVLDGRSARAVALGVFLAAAAFLAWIHRDDLFPPDAAAVAADDAVARCFAARAADIDAMRADGTINEAQANLFKSRAEALCQAQHGRGAGPPARAGQ